MRAVSVRAKSAAANPNLRAPGMQNSNALKKKAPDRYRSGAELRMVLGRD